jgi:hypothetical protein
MRRAFELFVFAPVGVALTVVEDLPGLISKGRQRFETDVRNARVIGQFVVDHGQRDVASRVSKLFTSSSPEDGEPTAPPTTPPTTPTATATPSATSPSATTPAAPEAAVRAAAESELFTPIATPKPAPDPADAIIVESALAGYDTLSASQVVRRLESLGPHELRAVVRHEASHRNRRTILNRAQQLLDTAGAEAAATDAAAEPDRPVG